VLTQEGFEVAAAEDGYNGLKLIEEGHFDIILLDLMMPGVSGMDILERVKVQHPDTVIIVITGYATLEHSVEAMKKGAFDFISKPFSPQDLRGVVAKAMEYIRTLEDIATEKSRMRVMIDCLPDGVMTTDAQKKVALANPAFLKMVGYGGRAVIGLEVKDLVLDEKIEMLIDRALAMPSDEFTQLTAEVTSRGLGDKEEKIFGVWCVPFRDRLGRNLGTVTVLHDITAIKKMDQLKSDFVSMVAHEVRSPLNTVLMQMKVLQDGLVGPVSEKQRDALGRVSERIKSLVELSSELLDLAKIESGLVTQEKERLDVGSLLKDQVAFHQPQAQQKDIELILEPLSKLPPVLGNRRNMDEVLSNLLSNAIKYTPEGGRVSVEAAVENNYLRIRVTDTGIGMAGGGFGFLFGWFFRVEGGRTRVVFGPGFGFGLFEGLFGGHNGMVTVDSEVDAGSTFKVYIPLMSS
jgi:PAS domain S-box-containing protein